MPRPNESERYELSPTEKRDLIALIEKGKPLPDRYRFLRFEDKREVELVWNGKTREVCTAVLPFQTLEHIDEPRRERGPAAAPGKKGRSAAAPDDLEQADLLDMSGRQIKGWTNKLIYMDPPFDVGTDFSMDIEIGDETFRLEQIAV